MKPYSILIVEDDLDHARSLVNAIEDMGFTIILAPTGAEGIHAFKTGHIDVVLSDLVLPDISGLQVMEHIQQLDSEVPVLIMTAYGSIDSSVQAMRGGAYDYITKPLDLDEIEVKLKRATETSALRRKVKELSAETYGKWSSKYIVSESAPMQDVIRETLSLAQTNATVAIRGESGTGKELIARALHADGPRAPGPFVAVNCAAFPETLLESELFGHEKGSFTGAVAQHKGAFERAEGGTLFLDEIGDAPKSVQAKLLRVLEDREVRRVGGQQSFKVDVRLVSATNQDLEALVEEGEFRQDLLYRLQVVAIWIPPLRNRRADIKPLAERFLAMAQTEHGRKIMAIEPGWFEKLESYDWPGNVRQLRNVVEAAVVTAGENTLRTAALRLDGAKRMDADETQATVPLAGGASWEDGLTLEQIERRILEQTLRKLNGNRSLAADQLGISRRTIQRKIKDYNLPF